MILRTSRKEGRGSVWIFLPFRTYFCAYKCTPVPRIDNAEDNRQREEDASEVQDLRKFKKELVPELIFDLEQT